MPRYSAPFRLSSHGSTRATAYNMTNKVARLGNLTHVTWLDAVAEVKTRTYDHQRAAWGDTVRLGTGCDNHSNPALSADAQGVLHLAYGPHGYWGNWNSSCVKHVVGLAPNNSATWHREANFGYQATYSSMVSTPAGMDALVYRGGEHPPMLFFQRQREKGGWEQAIPLLCQEIAPQYTHYGATITCDARGVIYVGGHFYNLHATKRSTGAAILRSADLGRTWTNLAGEIIRTPSPLTPQISAPSLAHPANDVRLAGMTVGPDGTFWVVTHSAVSFSTEGCFAWLSKWTAKGWETIDLAPFLPPGHHPHAGPVVVDDSGHIHLAIEQLPVTATGKRWGHPETAIYHLYSRDNGRTFSYTRLSPPQDTLANWHPSISQRHPFLPVAHPVILWTRGEPGEGCSPLTETEVFCSFIEDMT